MTLHDYSDGQSGPARPAGAAAAPSSHLLEHPTVLDLPGADTLDVSLVGGRLSVLAEPGLDGIHIEITRLKGDPLRVEHDGERLVIAYRERESGVLAGLFGAHERRVDITVRAPSESAWTVRTVSADVFAAEVHGGLAVTTVSGELVLDAPRGTVVARTTSGAVEVREIDGDLDTGSVSADVTVQALRLGRLRAESVSGDVTVDLAEAGEAPQEADVRSVSGAVLLRVPPGAGFALSARTMSGDVVAGEQRATGFGSRSLSDGDGRFAFRAVTVSGDVTLLRAAGTAVQPVVG